MNSLFAIHICMWMGGPFTLFHYENWQLLNILFIFCASEITQTCDLQLIGKLTNLLKIDFPKFALYEKLENNGKYRILELLELTVNRCRQWMQNRIYLE